jgi:hypothetical protein
MAEAKKGFGKTISADCRDEEIITKMRALSEAARFVRPTKWRIRRFAGRTETFLC